MWPQFVDNTLSRCSRKVHYRLTVSTVLCYRREHGLSDNRRKVPAQIVTWVPFPETLNRLLWFFVWVGAALAYKYEASGRRPNTRIWSFAPTIRYDREVAETVIRWSVHTRDHWQSTWTRDTASAASSPTCFESCSTWPSDALEVLAGKRSTRCRRSSRTSATSNTRRNSRMSCPIVLPRRHRFAVEMKGGGRIERWRCLAILLRRSGGDGEQEGTDWKKGIKKQKEKYSPFLPYFGSAQNGVLTDDFRDWLIRQEARAVVSSFTLNTNRPVQSIRPRFPRIWLQGDVHGSRYSKVVAWKLVGARRFRSGPGRHHPRCLQSIPLALRWLWRHTKQCFVSSSMDRYNYRVYPYTILTKGQAASHGRLTKAFWYFDERYLFGTQPSHRCQKPTVPTFGGCWQTRGPTSRFTGTLKANCSSYRHYFRPVTFSD